MPFPSSAHEQRVKSIPPRHKIRGSRVRLSRETIYLNNALFIVVLYFSKKFIIHRAAISPIQAGTEEISDFLLPLAEENW